MATIQCVCVYLMSILILYLPLIVSLVGVTLITICQLAAMGLNEVTNIAIWLISEALGNVHIPVNFLLYSVHRHWPFIFIIDPNTAHHPNPQRNPS